METAHIAKWGNSLAVRLPAALVRQLGLQEGDELNIDIDSARRLDIERRERREEILAGLDRFRGIAPGDFTFDRDEANAR